MKKQANHSGIDKGLFYTKMFQLKKIRDSHTRNMEALIGLKNWGSQIYEVKKTWNAQTAQAVNCMNNEGTTGSEPITRAGESARDWCWSYECTTGTER